MAETVRQGRERDWKLRRAERGGGGQSSVGPHYKQEERQELPARHGCGCRITEEGVIRVGVSKTKVGRLGVLGVKRRGSIR